MNKKDLVNMSKKGINKNLNKFDKPIKILDAVFSKFPPYKKGKVLGGKFNDLIDKFIDEIIPKM